MTLLLPFWATVCRDHGAHYRGQADEQQQEEEGDKEQEEEFQELAALM